MRSLRSRVAAGLAVGAALVTIPLTAGTASAATPEWELISTDHASQEWCEAAGAEKFVDPVFAEMYSDTTCTEEPDGEWTLWALTQE